MKKCNFVKIILSVLPFLFVGLSQAQNTKLTYPISKKVDVVDDYHGVKVPDPYRWLEDDKSAETKKWVLAQKKLTSSFFAQIPAQKKIVGMLKDVWNYDHYRSPWKKGGRYFFELKKGLQNQYVLYTFKTLDSEPTVLIDPTKFPNKTSSLAFSKVSDDGKYVAYGISESGSDWQYMKVRNIETGKDLADKIEWSKFGGAEWTKDGKGFFYGRYPTPKGGKLSSEANYYQKIYYHLLGTKQSQDRLIFETPEHKDWSSGVAVSKDGLYLIIQVYRGADTKNLVYFKKLDSNNNDFIPLVTEFVGGYEFIGSKGTKFWFATTDKTPNGSIVEVETESPSSLKWTTVVKESNKVIQSVSLISDSFVANYIEDVHSVVVIYDLKGKKINEIKLPGIGTANGFYGEPEDIETFYFFTGYTIPDVVFHYDFKTRESNIFRQPKINFNPDEYETKQVFYKSKDGTKIPLFLVYKKGIKLNGENPTILWGYGGFGYGYGPMFSPSNLVWLQMGGVAAFANIRGGNEYGEKWHEAAMKEKKQNCFDDFIAASEWLIKNKYTSTNKFAIRGGSNGGLLVAASMLQRPDLFGAVLPDVGVLDMLRFQKFTVGKAWTVEYGSSDNEEDFKYLYAYSPLHNIKKGTNYPPVLLSTADHDNRVVPGHTFKFAATLQEAQGGTNPVLVRIETEAGHGAGTPTDKLIEERSDMYAFLVKVLNMDFK